MSDYFTAPAPIVNSTTSDKVDVNNLTAAVEAGFDAAQADIEAGNVLFKKLDIGDWDMDATETVNITHGLEFHKNASVTGVVRGDATVFPSYVFDAHSNGGTSTIYISSINSTTIVLKRLTGGATDNFNYDSTSYNRGKLIVQYVL